MIPCFAGTLNYCGTVAFIPEGLHGFHPFVGQGGKNLYQDKGAENTFLK